MTESSITQQSSAPKTAIVFSCDEAYAFLARGLVLSLAAAGFPNSEAKLVLVDIGCGPQVLHWMKSQGVEVVDFDPRLIPTEVMAVIKPHQRAQVMRPWLPDMLPETDHIIWLNSDLWLQNGIVINILRTGANIALDSVMLAPGISNYNTTLYTDINRHLLMQRRWYERCYGPDFAVKAAAVLSYSTGVFGLKRSSPIWDLWKKEVQYIYPATAERDAALLHLAEQTALNVVILRTNLILRLDPLYNFHCDADGALRLADARVVTNMLLPVQEIGVIHLSNWSLLRGQYVQLQLLYRAGDYLWHDERARLLG
jgi:hypothetical protein